MRLNILSLLAQVLFMILPMFCYQIFWMDKPHRHHSGRFWAILLCCAVSSILCMTLPMSGFPGYIYDLRPIPFSLGLLYGGYRIGLPLFALILGYRFYIGGIGFYTTLLLESIVFVCLLRATRSFIHFDIRKKLLIGGSINLLYGVMTFIWYEVIDSKCSPDSKEWFVLIYTLLLSLTAVILIYLIELMRRNATIRDELHQLEKLKIVSEIAASVSHEVRNPLTVSRGFIQLLLKDESIEANRRSQYFRLALEELDRAHAIITDYLSFAKLQSSVMEVINVHDHVNYVIGILTPYAHMNDTQLQIHSIRAGTIKAEGLKFRQCLINLVKNAVEAASGGGSVSVTLDLEPEGYAVIHIVDTGVGMDKEQMLRLGTPKMSTKKNGTGLGLMISYNIVKSMGGSIQVTSHKGKGTHFTLRFPHAATEL